MGCYGNSPRKLGAPLGRLLVGDSRLRDLERAVSAGGAPDEVIALSAAYLRAGRDQEARTLLHPLVKKVPGARPLFLSLLPENANAFCHTCGDRFCLNSEGFPIGKNGRKANLKKRCAQCAKGVRRANVPRQKYCGRCGIVLREPAHRCTTKLPSWITGENSTATVKGSAHWSDWRATK